MSYVWYACYGSNINYDRFMRYINMCDDKTPPRESKPYTFPYELYFAEYSSIWKGAPCFLNVEKEGFTLGRRYLVTEEQFRTIQSKEGPNYTRKIILDPIDGIPVYSFTNENILSRKVPSLEYFNTIIKGLVDTYPSKDIEELKEYLLSRVYNEEELKVLKALKESEHKLNNCEISDRSGLSLDKIKDTVALLLNNESIKQDTINARTYNKRDDLASFYTETKNQGIIRDFVYEMVSIYNEVTEYHQNATINELESLCIVEGRPIGIFSTKYERSKKNRDKAIEIHGLTCMVCGFNFKDFYGDHGRDYIEVHHVKPLSTLDEEVVINPQTDLVCVCSNCHRMLHRNRDRVLTIEELKEIVNRDR